MKLGKHISDLLYYHDSVLLPGLGTFGTRYVPARFIPEKKIVESPAKRATFSPEPKVGNSPLPEYMAKMEKKPVEEVHGFLREVVNEIHNSLEQGKQVELEQLGRLSLDEQGMTRFEPDTGINFLEDATGIATVATSVPKAQAKTPDEDTGQDFSADLPSSQYEYTEEQLHNTKPDTNEPMEEKKATLSPALKWTAIIVVPLLLIALLLYVSFTLLIDDGRFFWQPTPPVVEVVDEDKEKPDDTDVLLAEPAEAEEEKEEVPVREEPAIGPLRPEPGKDVYYLVVGSFRNKEKAERLAENLRQAGAERAHVLSRTPSRYYRVSYGFYYDISEAERQKKALREDMKEIAWILHR